MSNVISACLMSMESVCKGLRTVRLGAGVVQVGATSVEVETDIIMMNNITN